MYPASKQRQLEHFYCKQSLLSKVHLIKIYIKFDGV